jgi:hypothetical protein
MKAQMKALLAAIGSVATLAAVAADQQPIRAIEKPLTKEEARFRALDSDNDRKLSDQEFRADTTSETEFASLDKDADGFLSMAEFVSRPIPPAKTKSTQTP